MYRVVFNKVSEVIRVCSGFALPLSVIGWKNSCLFLIQSEIRPKPVLTCCYADFRAWRRLRVFASICDWFDVLFASVMIGQWYATHSFLLYLLKLKWQRWRAAGIQSGPKGNQREKFQPQHNYRKVFLNLLRPVPFFSFLTSERNITRRKKLFSFMYGRLKLKKTSLMTTPWMWLLKRRSLRDGKGMEWTQLVPLLWTQETSERSTRCCNRRFGESSS